ncbi:MAG TPA: hypothetical protein DCL13_04155 [Peptococcaceae bacterium]|nr:hypothetical protein [Peptococcaceae bacterium]
MTFRPCRRPHPTAFTCLTHSNPPPPARQSLPGPRNLFHRLVLVHTVCFGTEPRWGNDPTGGTLYYWNPYKPVNPWVWSRPVHRQIGNHVFAY